MRSPVSSNPWLIPLLHFLRLYFLRLCCFLLACLFAFPAWAKVVVLANRTVSSITVGVVREGKLPKNLTIPSGDSQPVFFQRSLQVRFGKGLPQQQFPLHASSAYFFVRGEDGETLRLEQIGLGEQPKGVESRESRVKSQGKPSSPLVSGLSTLDSSTITVKILADENEPTHRRVWEPKLRKRVAEASKILERHSGIRLKVVEVTTWESDEKQRDFRQTLREFEQNVKTQPAQLAIGFSSQYKAARGRSHLGVTRWPMHTHILLRERSRNLLEAEKIELLVHELGHYLGASHSPEPQSVMRPLLTRGLQRGVGARIQFDPVNALIIAIMGEEIRQHGMRNIKMLSKPTSARLRQIYEVLQQTMPRDPAAQQYIKILDRISAPKATAQQRATLPAAPLVQDTRKVLAALISIAQQQSILKEGTTGDELTNKYVRQAAQSASRLRSANAQRAMLLALGIFLDDTRTLRSVPGIGSFIKSVESDAQRNQRIKLMGTPTMRDRADLTKHFFVSAHLVVVGGKSATSAAGLAKEMKDAQGGTGFSFVDMAANQAGIAFAEHVLSGALPLAELARGFHVDDYLPTLRGLKEGYTSADLQKNYGGEDQTTLAEEIDQIKQRVLDLPAYD